MREEEDLDLSLNLSYVSIGTVWYGTVRGRRGRWNMNIRNLVAAQCLQLPKRISYLAVVTNETMMNGQRQTQTQMKKKSRGDGRTPTSRGGHASCRETTNGQRSAALLFPWMCMLCTCIHRACTDYCFVVCPSLAGNMISSSYTQEKRIDGRSR